MIALRRSVLTALAAVATFCASPASASTLYLIGGGWTKSNVTVLIKAGGGVSQQAKLDVAQAVTDWDTALNGVTGAPNLTLLTSGNSADIVIQMKVGGGVVLGQTLPKTGPSGCDFKSVSIQLSGKAFGQSLSSAGTRNVARHELGHAFGLGHTSDDDVYDLMHATASSTIIYGTCNVPISSCNIDGLNAIYPFSGVCGTIPASIPCSATANPCP